MDRLSPLKKLSIMNYNIHAAIELRTQGIWDDMRGIQQPVDFKTSVALAKDYNFMWGWQYPGEDIMQAKTARESGIQVTKEVWKRWHRQYREYIRHSDNDSVEGFL